MMTGRILLVGRLALRDLQRRRVEAALLLLAILMATTTLTLGLVLRDAASDPYQTTRAATNGPDVVASSATANGRPELEKLAGADGVVNHSGPFPVASASFDVSGRKSDVQIVGRDTASAAVDQPKVTQGSWVRPGGVVLEAAFAAALDVRVGDTVTLDGRSFEVAGVAVSAAMAPYPESSCLVAAGCASGATPEELAKLPAGLLQNPGLVWLTKADIRPFDPQSYVVNLRLADPDGTIAFLDAYLRDGPQPPALHVVSWQGILHEATDLANDTRILLLIGAWLLGLLGVASLSVLVGGRMADQTRRVGLLKAAGGTPGLVAAVLLAEYVLVALVAAAAGLALGTLTAPLLAGSTAGLVGSAGTPSLTLSTVGLVIVVALGVAVLATVVPALRAARTSTVAALADAARPPRRTGWVIAVSARLPVPLLLALRIAARRPRRVVLAVLSIAITVSGIYVGLLLNAFIASQPLFGEYGDAQVSQLQRVLVVIMLTMLCLAAVNALVVTWATVLDYRHASALARALGATPREVTTALAAAQVLPAVAGALLGVFPGGLALFAAILAATGGDADGVTYPSLWQVAALVLAVAVVVAALTAVPARLGGRRPVAETLRVS